jgi:aryl-alcohol dehydrogenase-like predicted oxidoreductase
MTSRITIPQTDLHVFPLCLGGNVFGWTADQEQSFEVLDAFVAKGGNFIDTADVYSEWAPGNSGGESETILGKWMAARGNRAEMIIATKVSMLSSRPGLSANNILAAVDESLSRLQTDYIDLYYAHKDDPSVPLEETLGAFDLLIKAGKVRYIGASQHSGARLAQALSVSEARGLAKYSVLQNEYNLMERSVFEADSAPALKANRMQALPFFSLARGFLSGKYQPGVDIDSVRASGVEGYKTERGWAIVAAITKIAADHAVSPSAVSLAWLRSQPSVAAPIASARTVEQLAEIMQVVELSSAELELLGSL